MQAYDQLNDLEFIEELRSQFIDSAKSRIEVINNCLEHLSFDNKIDTLKLIRRELHTLKGEAQAVGFLKTAEFLHAMEDVIDRWPSEKLSDEICSKVKDMIIMCISELQTHVEILSIKNYESDLLDNWPNLINQLKALF